MIDRIRDRRYHSLLAALQELNAICSRFPKDFIECYLVTER
jgi:hypothetical protein